MAYEQSNIQICLGIMVLMLTQTVLSLVTIRTRIDWSNEEQTQRPCLSGLQSRLEMGCVDRVTFCRRVTDPATPMSALSAPFLVLWAGYSLEHEKSNDQSKNGTLMSNNDKASF